MKGNRVLFSHKLFASTFTGACCAVFLFPFTTTLHLAADPNVVYWLGYYPWVVLLVPALIAGVHIYHVWKQQAIRPLIMAAMIVPCVLFFLVGGCLLFQATHIIDGLVTSDCTSFRAVRATQLAYNDAAAVLADCRAQQPDAVLPECQKYVDEYGLPGHGDHWQYLRYVEENYGCSGFCQAAESGLWTGKPQAGCVNTPHAPGCEQHRDGCAMMVASALRGRVQHSSWQLMMYSIFVLFIFLGWMAAIGRKMQSPEERPIWQGGRV